MVMSNLQLLNDCTTGPALVRDGAAKKVWSRQAVQIVAVLCAMLIFTSGAPASEYKLDTGDVVEISVYGAPDLRRRVTVGPDGALAFPLLGTISVAELSLRELQLKLRNLLSEKDVVSNPDVTVEIVQYRPFFISGDVSRPGSHPYQPGMTVRHALALAGGIDVLRVRVSANPLMDAADLTNEHASLSMDLVRYQARMRRLKAEFANEKEIDFSSLSSTPIPASLLREITQSEQKLMLERAAELQNEKRYIERSLAQARAQLEALKAQQKGEEDGVKQQETDLTRVMGLNERGLAPSNRVLDEQRSIAASKSRLFATIAQVANANRVIEELLQQLARSGTTRTLDILRDIQETALTIEKARARMMTTTEKFGYVGQARASVMSVSRGSFRVIIFRSEDGKQVEIEGSDATPVRPSDVVEITMTPSFNPGFLMQQNSN
jgi:polysaccharide biosynthesis/export protein